MAHLSLNRERVVCFACLMPIYDFLRKPQIGEPLLNANPQPIGHQYEARADKRPECVHCGNYPFIYHNTGVQALTIDGELIPNG